MSFNEDVINVEILADGTLKITTDQVSAANHSKAEEFLKDLEQSCGAPATRTKRKGAGPVHVHHGVTHSH
jgi:hypothetical protein